MGRRYRDAPDASMAGRPACDGFRTRCPWPRRWSRHPLGELPIRMQEVTRAGRRVAPSYWGAGRRFFLHSSGRAVRSSAVARGDQPEIGGRRRWCRTISASATVRATAARVIGQSSSTCRALGLTTGTPKDLADERAVAVGEERVGPRMERTTVDLEEHASVDHAVVSAEAGEIDLGLDRGTRHLQILRTNRLSTPDSGRPVKSIDECGAAIGKRRQRPRRPARRVSTRSCSAESIAALACSASKQRSGRRERGLRRDDPVERISGRRARAQCTRTGASDARRTMRVARPRCRYRRMPHADASPDRASRAAGARRDAVRGT